MSSPTPIGDWLHKGYPSLRSGAALTETLQGPSTERWTSVIETFERKVHVTPAYDFVDSDDLNMRKYGRHGAELAFALVGPLGAASFDIGTNWFATASSPFILTRSTSPYAARVGLHSRVRKTDEDWRLREACNWLEGAVCWGIICDSGSELFKVLVTHGSNAMWKELEDYYERLKDTHTTDEEM